jgi:hypothetical protein
MEPVRSDGHHMDTIQRLDALGEKHAHARTANAMTKAPVAHPK